MSESRLIVGLGNPDKKYEYTRHNLGFLVLCHLAKQYKVEFTKSLTLKGLIASGDINDQKVILFLPLTYVNNSGVAVKEILKRKAIALQNILVVCDDLNLDYGHIRLRSRGSDGGHNGLSSIVEHLATNEFARLRLGIGCPSKKEDAVRFVLSVFNDEEKKELNHFIKRAVDCCRTWVTEGTTKAMSQFNKRKKEDE